MSRQLMMVSGVDGQIELMDDRVVIHRKGIFNMLKHGFHARREIPLMSITSVNFREATPFKMGEIDFAYAGRSQTDSKQNTVQFNRRQQKEFLMLKEKVFEVMMQSRK